MPRLWQRSSGRFRKLAQSGKNTTTRPASLDNFVGGGQQQWRNGEAEGFGGLQIDDQLETRGLLDRQIAGLCAFEDLVDIADRAAKMIGKIRSIRQQQAVSNLFSIRCKCRYLVRHR